MTTHLETPEQERQRHRARYEALRAQGQGTSVSSLPQLTARSLPLPDGDGAELHHETVPGGWYWTTRLRRGQAVRLINSDGTSAVSLIAWSHADTSERVNTADTMKIQWSTGLRKGRVIYTEMGRVALSIIEDTSAAHDPLMGPTTSESVKSIPGAGEARNSRDNFLKAAAKLGLSRRDVPACINFFAPVGVAESGRFIWREGQRSAGDFVDLRAEMDLWLVISNAGHPLDPNKKAVPSPIDVVRFTAPPITDTDPCRQACDEAIRAFDLTHSHSLK
ncbi:MAG: hypothetical protein JWQ07_998 [Ramlibacter sp.]|nr:hypothetical protein [Ramlibacter sp.]